MTFPAPSRRTSCRRPPTAFMRFSRARGSDWAALTVLLLIVFGTFGHADDPASPMCRFIAKNSLPFCTMIDYHAVVDQKDPYGLESDDSARQYYGNVDVVLQRFGCNMRYSLYKCEDCREAYKYWICSIKFQKCGATTPLSGNTPIYYHALCPQGFTPITASNPAPADDKGCVEGRTGRYRTCLSLCEDVVRKCPYVLNFQCPTTQTTYFSSDISTCNKLDRETNPDKPNSAWPGTFGDL